MSVFSPHVFGCFTKKVKRIKKTRQVGNDKYNSCGNGFLGENEGHNILRTHVYKCITMIWITVIMLKILRNMIQRNLTNDSIISFARLIFNSLSLLIQV